MRAGCVKGLSPPAERLFVESPSRPDTRGVPFNDYKPPRGVSRAIAAV